MVKKLKKLWKFLAVLLLLALLILSRLGTNSKKALVKEYKVTKQTLSQTLVLSGKVDATEKVNLRFQTSGRLVWVAVKPDDIVKAYQGLASLDKREVEAYLKKRLNSYMKTRWDFSQLNDDTKDNIFNDKLKRILEKSQFDLESSVLDVEIQHLAVEYASLVTPIAGIVTKIESAVAGVNITPSEAEIEVVNPLSIYLSILPDQTEVTKLTPGMSVDIIFDAYPDEHVKGEIQTVSFSPKTGETGTVYEGRVKLAISNSSYRYRLGMTADASFVTSQKPDVLAVPLSFIKQENSKRYVLKLTNGKTTKTFLTLGDETDTLAEVTSGLSEGDIIVLQ